MEETLRFYSLVLLVVVHWIVTIGLWNTIRRGPKRKFRRALDTHVHDPITPRHDPTLELEKEEGWVSDDNKQFFSDFGNFADHLNHRLTETQWRVQETPRVHVGIESPEYGRGYQIFFNQIKIGFLKMQTGVFYTPKDQFKVRADIEINYSRLLSFYRIQNFVMEVAYLIASNRDDIQEIRIELHDAMLRKLWPIEYDYYIDDRSMGGILDIRFSGSAAHYRTWAHGRSAAQVS
jgi:hypothetical protein